MHDHVERPEYAQLLQVPPRLLQRHVDLLQSLRLVDPVQLAVDDVRLGAHGALGSGHRAIANASLIQLLYPVHAAWTALDLLKQCLVVWGLGGVVRWRRDSHRGRLGGARGACPPRRA
jgi:hypothetical protein